MKKFSFRELKQKIPIMHIFNHYEMDKKLKPRGNQWIGPCPLHCGDNKTAFHVNEIRNVWYCFTACGGGDIIDLIRKIENCDYKKASEILNNMALYENPTKLQMRNEFVRYSKSEFRPFRGRLYLNPIVPFLQKEKHISVQTALYFEAGETTKSKFLNQMIAVRLHDLEGNPLGYCGRRLDPLQIAKWGKWRFPYQFPKSQCLYNAHRTLHLNNHGIILVECPWAVMRLYQMGLKKVVALLGTTLSDNQIHWLITNSLFVFLCLDGDLAGRKAAHLIKNMLSPHMPVFIYDLPEGYDPEDLSEEALSTLSHLYFSLDQ